MAKENKNAQDGQDKDYLAWLDNTGITQPDIDGWKAKRRGVKCLEIRPYDDDEDDVVRIFVQPLSRKEMELLATSRGNVSSANKKMVRYSVLGGDTDRLEEGPVFSALLEQLEETNKAKSVERKNC